MPGKNATSWGRTWKTADTRVIRVPASLADQLIKLAHAIEDGGKVTVVPAPDLFTQPAKRKKPVTGDVPHGTKSAKGKPVTVPRKRKVSS